MTLRSVLYFYVVPLCGDLLSIECLVFVLLYCLLVAVCVLLSIRNENLYVCACVVVGCSGVGTTYIGRNMSPM
jgi:hypothetical protein